MKRSREDVIIVYTDRNPNMVAILKFKEHSCCLLTSTNAPAFEHSCDSEQDDRMGAAKPV